MRPLMQKDLRIDFRFQSKQKELLHYAAAAVNMSVPAFIKKSALKEAKEIVSEKIQFVLPNKQWKVFCDRLDQPAQSIPKLKKLFAAPSIFHE